MAPATAHDYPSELADLRRVPLGDFPALRGDVLSAALRRLVPLDRPVTVAAFTSAIGPY